MTSSRGRDDARVLELIKTFKDINEELTVNFSATVFRG